MKRSALVLLAGAWAAAACSPVSGVQLRSDYEAVDRTETVRLHVAVAPLPAEATPVAAMWAHMARDYTNHHRDFLVISGLADAKVPAGICAGDMQGVLELTPSVRRADDEVALVVIAHLKRCRDGQTIWRAQGAGQWPSKDEQLLEVRRRYEARFGPSIGPYVAPSWRLLRAVLAELPRPKLTRDEDVMAKIELD